MASASCLKPPHTSINYNTVDPASNSQASICPSQSRSPRGLVKVISILQSPYTVFERTLILPAMLTKTSVFTAIAVAQSLATAIPVHDKRPGLERREIEIIDLPLGETPQVIEHTGLDEAGISDLVASLSSTFPPAPTAGVEAATAQLSAVAVERRQASDPFLITPNGEGNNCPETIINGPITTLQALTGSSSLRGISATDMNQTKTDVFGVVGFKKEHDFDLGLNLWIKG